MKELPGRRGTGNILTDKRVNNFMVGGVPITFKQTVRTAADEVSDLPAGLGNFPLYRVADFASGCPSHWREGGLFFPMYPQEAMWINFGKRNPAKPQAMIIGAGNINAISGRAFDPNKDKYTRRQDKPAEGELEIMLDGRNQNYVVLPDQPWLDGWKSPDGTVRQFVAAEMGSGQTVEGQVTGEESVGGIQIIVYNHKPGLNLTPNSTPTHYQSAGLLKTFDFGGSFGGDVSRTMMLSDSKSSGASIGGSIQDMGLGFGGQIRQKIYPDTYGIDVWNPNPTDVVPVYMVSSHDFQQITGCPPPPTPVPLKDYQEQQKPWFKVNDEDLGDAGGTSLLDILRPVSDGNK